jgi:hypothetical protein
MVQPIVDGDHALGAAGADARTVRRQWQRRHPTIASSRARDDHARMLPSCQGKR